MFVIGVATYTQNRITRDTDWCKLIDVFNTLGMTNIRMRYTRLYLCIVNSRPIENTYTDFPYSPTPPPLWTSARAVETSPRWIFQIEYCKGSKLLSGCRLTSSYDEEASLHGKHTHCRSDISFWFIAVTEVQVKINIHLTISKQS